MIRSFDRDASGTPWALEFCKLLRDIMGGLAFEGRELSQRSPDEAPCDWGAVARHTRSSSSLGFGAAHPPFCLSLQPFRQESAYHSNRSDRLVDLILVCWSTASMVSCCMDRGTTPWGCCLESTGYSGTSSPSTGERAFSRVSWRAVTCSDCRPPDSSGVFRATVMTVTGWKRRSHSAGSHLTHPERLIDQLPLRLTSN